MHFKMILHLSSAQLYIVLLLQFATYGLQDPRQKLRFWYIFLDCCTSKLTAAVTLHNYPKQRLNVHFEDVFWPMAHSVQVGHGMDCARWAVKWSILQILLHISKLQTEPEREIFSENVETIISAQSVQAANWGGNHCS